MTLVDELRKALAGHQPLEIPSLPGRSNHLRAAVLVPVVDFAEPECVLTERSRRLREHAGEISFPGGRPEACDPDLQSTALREAEEEIGLRKAEVLGRLSTVPLYTSDYRLVPYVAHVPEQPLRAQTVEVSAVLRISLRATLDQGWLHAIPWTYRGEDHLSPVFEVDGRLVYGATAHVLYELVTIVAAHWGEPAPTLHAGRYEWQDVLRS